MKLTHLVSDPRSIIDEMEKRGFQHVGTESITRFKLSPEAKFETIIFRKTQDIRNTKRAELEKRTGPAFQVKITLRPIRKERRQISILIFAKAIKKR